MTELWCGCPYSWCEWEGWSSEETQHVLTRHTWTNNGTGQPDNGTGSRYPSEPGATDESH